MKFPTYTSHAEWTKQLWPQRTKGMTLDEIQRLVYNNTPKQYTWMRKTMTIEGTWLDAGRPYYRVWPGVLESLQKLDFGRMPTSVAKVPHGLIAIACHLATPVPATYIGVEKNCDTMLAFNIGNVFGIVVNLGIRAADRMPDVMIRSFYTDTGGTIEEALKSGKKPLPDGCQRVHDTLMRLAVGLALLEDDPDLISPDVLADDRACYMVANAEERERLAAKARRRGKFGFDIGRGLYDKRGISPHYRHPHFAIRWTEKGRSVPRLCHVKGSFVHRHQMTEVPTGYLDDEATDAKPAT